MKCQKVSTKRHNTPRTHNKLEKARMNKSEQQDRKSEGCWKPATRFSGCNAIYYQLPGTRGDQESPNLLKDHLISSYLRLSNEAKLQVLLTESMQCAFALARIESHVELYVPILPPGYESAHMLVCLPALFCTW